MLAKTKLNSIEVLISKALIDSYTSHDEFVLINVLKEYDDMKDKIENPSNRYVLYNKRNINLRKIVYQNYL